MTFDEERLAYYEKQLEMAKAGFEIIAKRILSRGGENIDETLEQYILAIKDLKNSVAYYHKQLENAKAKTE